MTLTEPAVKPAPDLETNINKTLLDHPIETSSATGLGAAYAAARELWSSLWWLAKGMFEEVGVFRTVRISFQAFCGSVAISTMGFAVIFAIRSVAPGGSDGVFKELPIPDIEIGPMLAIILIGGTVGAYLSYRSEQLASKASVEYGDWLRRRVTDALNRPLSRGWQTALDGKPQRVLVQAVVAGVREITMAARETLRLVGPASMFLVSVLSLFLLEPVVTLLLFPIAAMLVIPTYLINQRMSGLNESFDAAQAEASAELATAVSELLENGLARNTTSLLEAAGKGDTVTHDRMLEPVRLRAISVVLTALFAVAVLLVFLVRAGEDLDFLRMMIYIIIVRLCASAAQRIANAAIAITRRAKSIERYRALMDALDAYEQSRIDRVPTEDFPDEIFIGDAEGYSLDLQRGTTAVVLVRRPPTKATADEFLLLLEQNLDEQGITSDLLESTNIVLDEKDLYAEEHVVTGEASDLEYPVVLSIGIDVSTAALFNGNSINLVLTHMPAEAWERSLEQWSHLVHGVVIVDDNEIKAVGSLEWARDHREDVLTSLGRL